MTLTTANGEFQRVCSPALSFVWAKTSQHWKMYWSSVETQVNVKINTFRIGVDADKSFATRWLLDHIALLGLSISSDEIMLTKQSAAVSDSVEATKPEHFTKWVGDNVDHNIRTLTGKGRFHGMGIIFIRSN